MQNIMAAFPSKYLRASDFDEPQLLTIVGVKTEEVSNGEHKPILLVKEHNKGVVLNKTNARTISKIYGTDPSKWSEKQIVAFSAMVEFRGDMVESIRFRAPRTRPAQIMSGGKMTKESENPADEMSDEIPF